MIIRSLNIEEFGKFKERKISFRSGVNVVTGGNDSGKTTIADYIYGMLFGLDAQAPSYKKYFPKEGRAFGGSMTVLVEEEMYEIRRSFLEGQETLKICKADTSEEIADPEAWLQEQCAGIDMKMYADTGFISAEVLNSDIEKLFAGDPEAHAKMEEEEKIREQLIQGKQKLSEKREKLTLELKSGIEEKKTNLERLLSDNNEKIEILSQRIPEQEKEYEEVQSFYNKEVVGRKEEIENRRSAMAEELLQEKDRLEDSNSGGEKQFGFTGVIGTIAMVAGILLGICGWFIKDSYGFNYSNKMHLLLIGGFAVVAFLILFGLFCIIFGIVKRRKNEKQLSGFENLQEELNKKEEAYQKFLRDSEEEVKDLKKDEHEQKLSEKMKDLKRDQQTLLGCKAYVKELSEEMEKTLAMEQENKDRQKEIECLDMALAAFNHAIEEIPDEVLQPISGLATERFRDLGFSSESELVLTRDWQIFYKEDVRENNLLEETASNKRGAALAVRLARIELMDPEKKMPLVLDDAFSAFDEDRMQNAMRILRNSKRQVLVFSCQYRERLSL